MGGVLFDSVGSGKAEEGSLADGWEEDGLGPEGQSGRWCRRRVSPAAPWRCRRCLILSTTSAESMTALAPLNCATPRLPSTSFPSTLVCVF